MTSRSSSFSSSVIGRDECCQECGSATGLQAHHIIPISKFGADTVENGVALCPGCHADVHPDVPRALFFSGPSGSVVQAPYNAASMAAKLDCCTRTIIRAAKRLGIERHGAHWAFSENNLKAIKENVHPWNAIKKTNGTRFVYIRLPVDLIDALDERRWQSRYDSRNELVVELLERSLGEQPAQVSKLVVAAGAAVIEMEFVNENDPKFDKTIENLRAALAPFETGAATGDEQ